MGLLDLKTERKVVPDHIDKQVRKHSATPTLNKTRWLWSQLAIVTTLILVIY
jgi:hypothetical protein